MLDQDKILYFLRVTGPTLPGKVAKNIKTEILLASAHLSDLASQKKVKISYLKVGGSPLYYLPGQEEQLFSFAVGNLNQKDYDVLEKLKAKKILRESELDLLHKVSLRSLRDFAVPLQVAYQGKTELFWKWYLLSAEEANGLIGNMLEPKKEEASSLEIVQQPLLEKPPVAPPEAISEGIEAIIPSQPEALEEKIRKEQPRKARKKTIQSDNLLEQVEDYFRQKEIEIDQKEVIRKNAELNLIAKVPSVLGTVTHFCKIKKKRICDEKDLSAAYVEAQVKKLPLLFLYMGTLSKKAQELLESKVFENVIVKKVE